MGTRTEMVPTPMPATNLSSRSAIHRRHGKVRSDHHTYLPTSIIGMAWAQTWNMHPKLNTVTAAIKDIRRPKWSPTGAASKDPNTVPILRIATRIAVSFGASARPWASMWPVENWSLKDLMARIPLIVLYTQLAGQQPGPQFLLQCARSDRQISPCIITKQKTSGGNKYADHDGRSGGAGDIVWLAPAHGNGHGERVETVRPGPLYDNVLVVGSCICVVGDSGGRKQVDGVLRGRPFAAVKRGASQPVK